MAFLSGSFGVRDYPAVLEALANVAPARALHRPRPGGVLRRRLALERPDLLGGRRRVGRGRLRASPHAASPGSRGSVRGLWSRGIAAFDAETRPDRLPRRGGRHPRQLRRSSRAARRRRPRSRSSPTRSSPRSSRSRSSPSTARSSTATARRRCTRSGSRSARGIRKGRCCSPSSGPRPASRSVTPRSRRRKYPAADGRPLRSPQRRDRCPRRPRQDDARRRDALAVRRLPREPGRERARARLDGPRAREGDHDPRQEHGLPLRRHQDQHRRHPGSRRLRRRGRAWTDHGRRRPPARGRERRPAAADTLRPAQGARGAAAGDPRRQQGRPARRADRGGRERGLRALPRSRRRREPDRVPDRLHERPRRARRPEARRARRRPAPALRAPARAHSGRRSTTPTTRCKRS